MSVRVIEFRVILRRGARRLASFVVEIEQAGQVYEVEGELLRTGKGALYTRPVLEVTTFTFAGLELPLAVRWPRNVEQRIDDLVTRFWNAGGRA